ncbi:hypothetical protein F5X68DRAFT_263376, partial [Plectosphaerella plurivora]
MLQDYQKLHSFIRDKDPERTHCLWCKAPFASASIDVDSVPSSSTPMTPTPQTAAQYIFPHLQPSRSQSPAENNFLGSKRLDSITRSRLSKQMPHQIAAGVTQTSQLLQSKKSGSSSSPGPPRQRSTRVTIKGFLAEPEAWDDVPPGLEPEMQIKRQICNYSLTEVSPDDMRMSVRDWLEEIVIPSMPTKNKTVETIKEGGWFPRFAVEAAIGKHPEDVPDTDLDVTSVSDFIFGDIFRLVVRQKKASWIVHLIFDAAIPERPVAAPSSPPQKSPPRKRRRQTTIKMERGLDIDIDRFNHSDDDPFAEDDCVPARRPDPPRRKTPRAAQKLTPTADEEKRLQGFLEEALRNVLPGYNKFVKKQQAKKRRVDALTAEDSDDLPSVDSIQEALETSSSESGSDEDYTAERQLHEPAGLGPGASNTAPVMRSKVSLAGTVKRLVAIEDGSDLDDGEDEEDDIAETIEAEPPAARTRNAHSRRPVTM